MTESHLMYTPSITIVRTSLHTLTVPKSKESHGSVQFATDSQGRTQTSDIDPWTGTFPQTWPTVGDTACTVNRVLGFCSFHQESEYTNIDQIQSVRLLI